MKALWREHGLTFGKSQVTALGATGVDFCTLVFAVEVLGLHYLLGVVLGALAGGTANYLWNRRWAFGSSGTVSSEAARYAFVSAGSLLWNVALVYVFTAWLGLVYFASKLIVAVLVGFGWNYPLHRYWVFVKEEEHA